VHAPSLAVPPPGRAPLVVTVHDLAFLTHPGCFTARGRAFHARGLELARREALVVVVPSRFTGDELAAHGFPGELIHVVPHGIDLPPERSEAASPVPGPFVLAVGTVEPRKGIDVLLEAFSRLDGSGARLVIAGPRGWGEVPDLDRPGVVALGRVDEATLDGLYRHAAVLAVPSRTEGFGLPVLEAMARGCPVVASDAGALPEVVGDAGILVPAGDPEALAAALGALLADENRRAALAAAGRRRTAEFTWPACLDGHLRAYEAALA